MAEEKPYIIAPVPQRRDMDHEKVDPIVEIPPEQPFFDQLRLRNGNLVIALGHPDTGATAL